MNYAIFRSEPIYTLNDLAQIGSHNKREKLIEKICRRELEVVRWSLSSSLILIMNFMVMCKSEQLRYDMNFLKEAASYICRLYSSCDQAEELFVVDFSKYIYSAQIHTSQLYILDILEDNSYKSIQEGVVGPQEYLRKYFDIYAIKKRDDIISRIRAISK